MPVDVIGVLVASERDFNPKLSSGFHVRGLFYGLLKSADPQLASRIHDFRGLAPFSVSPILKLYPGAYYLKMTSFMTRLTDALLEALKKSEELVIGGRRFLVTELTYSRIDTDKLLTEAEAYTRYELEFISPTCFRRPCPYIPLHTLGIFARIMGVMKQPKSTYRYYPLPDPILMLRNLKRQWEQYTGTTIRSKRFTRWLEEGGVALSGVNGIKTHRFTHRRRKIFAVGFTGKARISLPENTFRREEAKIVNALLKLGEKTQVGVNRTAGFGLYKILKTRD